MRRPSVIAGLACLGGALCALLLATEPAFGEAAEREILYWVAPMDPSYHSDQPGKSPMGMDLVPVYADAGGEGGIVSIDPLMVQNLGVRTAVVERTSLPRLINTVGYVAFDEGLLSHLHLRAEGWIERLYVKSNGERVHKGDLLLALYSRELVNAQQEYLQALRGANAYLQGASRERLRALGMEDDQIDEVARQGRASQRVRIRASQDGIVHNLNVREGMFVTPGTEVMALADLSSVWLLVDLFERQSAWVAVGQPAEVRLAYLPGRVWKGEVAFVYPTIDPRTRTLQARLRFPNPDEALKPDMYAQVRLQARPRDNVLNIPREALISTGDGARVILALGEGRFKPQDVVAGIESGDRVAITSGLHEGDSVVVSGQFLIDSEASLRASFLRMGNGGADRAGQTPPQPLSGIGRVNAIDRVGRRINLSHEPIEALGWPAMSMDFAVTRGVDFDRIETGKPVYFTLVKDKGGNYLIDGIRPATGKGGK